MRDALEVWKTRDRVARLVEDARATQLQRRIAGQNRQVIQREICSDSLLLANSACPSKQVLEFSSASGAPTMVCEVHRPVVRPQRRLGDGSTRESTPSDLGYDTAPSGDAGDGGTTDSGAPARRDSFPDDTSLDSSGDRNDEETGSRPPRLDTDEDDTPPPPSARRMTSPRADGRLARRSSSGVRRETVSESRTGEQTPEAEDESAVTICADSGDVATSACPVTMQEFFPASQRPRRRCTLH